MTAGVSIIAPAQLPDVVWLIPRRIEARYEIWKRNLLLGLVHDRLTKTEVNEKVNDKVNG